METLCSLEQTAAGGVLHNPFMLFDKFSARSLHLANHMVMAPMTRSRATTQHTPDALMATSRVSR